MWEGPLCPDHTVARQQIGAQRPLPHCLTIVQTNEPWRSVHDDHEKIIVLSFGYRHSGGGSEGVDDLRQSVGMPNDKRVSSESFQLCD